MAASTRQQGSSSSTSKGSGPAARRISNASSSDKNKGKARLLDDADADADEAEDQEARDDADSLNIIEDDEDTSMHCSICLSIIDNRTVVQPCGHDAYCFVCILAWTEQSRRCPLCTQAIELLNHNIRSDRDFQRHYLPPLLPRSKSPPPDVVRTARSIHEGARKQLYDRPTHPRFRFSEWRARNRPAEMDEEDAEDLALQKRRYIYRHKLFVKHVASNRFTRYRDHSAQQIAASQELKQRLTKWVRRELRVFEGVDLEFLAGYVVSIASQLELRSDSSTRLLSEFLGAQEAEHFLHETYSFLRSPYKDIRNYDKAVQYDRPERKSLSPASAKISLQAIDTDRTSHPTPSSRSNGRPDPDSYRKRRDSRGSRYSPELPSKRRASEGRLPPRRGGDTYVPEYSRLHRPAPARKAEAVPPPTSSPIKDKERPPVTSEPIEQKTVEIAAMPVEVDEVLEAAAIDESDVEDVISLGEMSDTEPVARPRPRTESAPARVQISILGRSRRSRATPIPEEDQAEASSPRGHPSTETVTARSLAREDDLRSRLAQSARSLTKSAPPSAQPPSNGQKRRMSDVKRTDLEQRLLNAKAGSSANSSSPTPLRKGTVSADLKKRLMGKLEDEMKLKLKESLNSGTARAEAEKTKEQEEVLRNNVLAMLASKKGKRASSEDRLKSQPADTSMTNGLKSVRASSPTTSTTAANGTDKLLELKARVEKERKLSSLKARLMAEKAAKGLQAPNE